MVKAPWPAFSPDELIVMAKTLHLEAQGDVAQRGVAHVILNRFKQRPKYGVDLAGVCLKAWAFSGWNEDNPRLPRTRRMTLGNSFFLRASTASALQTFDEYDFTQGSTHYHAKDIEQVPKWAFGHAPAYSDGNHLFYNNIT